MLHVTPVVSLTDTVTAFREGDCKENSEKDAAQTVQHTLTFPSHSKYDIILYITWCEQCSVSCRKVCKLHSESETLFLTMMQTQSKKSETVPTSFASSEPLTGCSEGGDSPSTGKETNRLDVRSSHSD